MGKGHGLAISPSSSPANSCSAGAIFPARSCSAPSTALTKTCWPSPFTPGVARPTRRATSVTPPSDMRRLSLGLELSVITASSSVALSSHEPHSIFVQLAMVAEPLLRVTSNSSPLIGGTTGSTGSER